MSASLKMLRRHGFSFKDKTEVINLIQNMPIGFYKEVLLLNNHSLKDDNISDERLPTAWGNAVSKIMSKIDLDSSTVSETDEMTREGSILSEYEIQP